MIDIDTIDARGWRYRFPTIDFKFQNAGTTTAFLWQFVIEISHAEVDVTPALGFTAAVEDGRLVVLAKNDGWGAANNLSVQLQEALLNHFFDGERRMCCSTLRSGEKRKVGALWLEPNKIPELEVAVRASEQPSRMRSRWEENTDPPHVRLGDIQAIWSVFDDGGRHHNGADSVRVSWDGYVGLSALGFIGVEWPPPCASAAASDVTYVVMIDPTKGPHERTYPISRQIPPGDIERFHILIGSPKSCSLRLRFKFLGDQNAIVQSEAFDISIWNPRNSNWDWDYTDGDELLRHRDEVPRDARTSRMMSSWQQERALRKAARVAQFPFHDDSQGR